MCSTVFRIPQTTDLTPRTCPPGRDLPSLGISIAKKLACSIRMSVQNRFSATEWDTTSSPWGTYTGLTSGPPDVARLYLNGVAGRERVTSGSGCFGGRSSTTEPFHSGTPVK